VQAARANADLATKAKLATIGKLGRSIDQNDGAINFM
jgi:hypothetical protein